MNFLKGLYRNPDSRLHLFLISLLGVVAYFNMPFTDFIGDDIGRITTREYILKEGLARTLQDLLSDRPFLMITIWINYVLSGLNPLYFKITNVLLHIATGYSVYFLFKKLLKDQSHYRLLSFLIAGIFIAHPINNQAVNSIIQRGVELSTLFSILGLLTFLNSFESLEKRNSKTTYLLSIFFFILAILSKPNSIILPLLIFTLSNFLFPKSRTRILKRLIPHFFVLLIPIFYYRIGGENIQENAVSSFNYLLIQSKVVFFYFSKYVLPERLSFFYFVEKSSLEYIDAWSSIALTAHLTFIFGGLFLAFKEKSRAALFMVSGYITLIPESSVFSILHLAFDHRNYFSMIFFFASLLIFLSKFIKVQFLTTFFVLLILVFSAVNLKYTDTISTFEKWLMYNASANPHYKKFYTHFITVEIKRNHDNTAKKLIDYSISKNPNDRELLILSKIPFFESLDSAQKSDALKGLYQGAFANAYSFDMFEFAEFYLNQKLPFVFDEKKSAYKMNDFYFTFLDRITSITREYEMIGRIEKNFISVVTLNKRESSSPQTFFDNIEIADALLALRNLIGLKYYFFYPFDETPYLEILNSRYHNLEAAKQILNWQKELKVKRSPQ